MSYRIRIDSMQQVALIFVDREAWAKELKSSIAAAAERHTGDSGAVSFTESQEGADLVICLRKSQSWPGDRDHEGADPRRRWRAGCACSR